jgi:hypothetical protein
LQRQLLRRNVPGADHYHHYEHFDEHDLDLDDAWVPTERRNLQRGHSVL